MSNPAKLQATHVQLSIAEFVKSNINAIYKTSSQAASEDTISKFVSSDAHIYVNGNTLNRSELVKEFRSGIFLDVGATVKYLAETEVPADELHPSDAGTVGISFTVTVEEALRILGGPAERKINATMIAAVVQNPYASDSTQSGTRGDTENRVLKKLILVIRDDAVPVKLALPNAPPAH